MSVLITMEESGTRRDGDVLRPDDGATSLFVSAEPAASRMSGKRLVHCPRCHGVLCHTGAFWTCGACTLAITDQALRVDLQAAQGGEPNAEALKAAG
ncbi:hypothetical protein [Nitrospira sp. Kam-Ns4a]